MNAKLTADSFFPYFVPFSPFHTFFIVFSIFVALFEMFQLKQYINTHWVTCARAKFLMQCHIFLPHTLTLSLDSDDSTNKFPKPHPQWLMICLFLFGHIFYIETKFVRNRIRCAPCCNYCLERDSNVKINNDTCVI